VGLGRAGEAEGDFRRGEAEHGGDADDKSKKRVFWTANPQMGLANIEWVVIDEAGVLFGVVYSHRSIVFYLQLLV
jgi:hypothetical protein